MNLRKCCVSVWGECGKTIQGLGALKEPVIGAGSGIAIVFVQRTMKVVRAALGDQRDLGAGRPALIGIVVGGCNAEFLDRDEG